MEAAQRKNTVRLAQRSGKSHGKPDQTKSGHRCQPQSKGNSEWTGSIHSIIRNIKPLAEIICKSNIEMSMKSGWVLPDIDKIVTGFANLYPLACEARGIEPSSIPPKLNIHQQASWYYDRFEKMAAPDVSLNIEFDFDELSESNLYDKPHLCYYKYSKYPDHTIFAIPLEFLPILEKDHAELYKITVNIFRNIVRRWFENDFDMSGHYGWIIEMLTTGEGGDEYMELDEDDPDRLAYEAVFTEYSNEADYYMKLIDHGNSESNIEILEKMESLKIQGKWYKTYRNLLREALVLLMENNYLGNFDYNPEMPDRGDDEFEDAVELVPIWNIIRFVWSTRDVVFDQYLRDVNTDIGEFGVESLCWVNVINERKLEFREYDDFSERAVNWFSKMISHLEIYLEKNKPKTTHE